MPEPWKVFVVTAKLIRGNANAKDRKMKIWVKSPQNREEGDQREWKNAIQKIQEKQHREIIQKLDKEVDLQRKKINKF